jgi:hypothetical protein
LLSAEQFGAGGGFLQKVHAATQQLDLCNDGCTDIRVIERTQTFNNLWVVGVQVSESISIEQVH